MKFLSQWIWNDQETHWINKRILILTLNLNKTICETCICPSKQSGMLACTASSVREEKLIEILKHQWLLPWWICWIFNWIWSCFSFFLRIDWCLNQNWLTKHTFSFCKQQTDTENWCFFTFFLKIFQNI